MISMEQVITVVRAGGTGRLIDTAIVPLTVLTLVTVFNSVLDVTQYEDPSDDTSFYQLSWKDDENVTRLLQAVQNSDGYVVVRADLVYAFATNKAAVFAQTKGAFTHYTLKNCAIQGNLAVDLSQAIDGLYNITIFETSGQHPSAFTAKGKLIEMDTPGMTLYLTVKDSVLMATNDSSNAKQFSFNGANTDSCCIPSLSLPDNNT